MNAPAQALSHGPAAVVAPLRLNLGCGRSALPGWINVDQVKLPGVDLVQDLNNMQRDSMWGMAGWDARFSENSVDQFMMSHTIEHITNTLPLMQELHRIAKPDALCTIRCPYGSSDDADEDPTHVRRYFLGSWGYFSQPYFWKAQYNTKHEKDMFGRWLHQNPQCPWFLPQPLSQIQKGPTVNGSDSAKEDLLIRGMHSAPLCEGIVSPACEAIGNRTSVKTNSQEEAERSGSVLEGRIHLSDRPGRGSGVRAQVDNGTASAPPVIPVGERASRQWGSVEQFTQELGTVVQATAGWSESQRLVELGRFVLSAAGAKTPEIGSEGCCCTGFDYGYRGDWQAETIELVVLASRFNGLTMDEALNVVHIYRNVVREMIVTMRAVKPVREPKRELQVQPTIKFVVLP